MELDAICQAVMENTQLFWVTPNFKMEVYILLSKCSAIPIIWQHFMYFMSLANERCGKVRLLTIAAYIERHFELKIQVGKLYVIRCSWFFCTCFKYSYFMFTTCKAPMKMFIFKNSIIIGKPAMAIPSARLHIFVRRSWYG